MVALGKRVVILRGTPIQVENGAAGATIKPGYLVDGVTTILAHATAGGVAPRALALERDELGRGIDTSYQDSAGSPNYASGDQVKVALCHTGIQFTGWIASGQNIAVNDRLESAGNGTFRIFGSGTILARALEAVDASGFVTEEQKIKLEFM